MKILMTGATGYIGNKLCLKLIKAGHSLRIVTRNQSKAAQIVAFTPEWIECDLMNRPLKAENFTGVDAVINLIGENIDGRWTKEKKRLIIDSRVASAKNLLQHCPDTLKTLLTVSAQGYYGDRGDEILDESATRGSSFLTEVCEAWEKPFRDWAERTQTRVVILRLGLVLSPEGGALKKLISIFKMNLAAPLGSGKQWMSFIHLDDLNELFVSAISDDRYHGVINAVAPEPIRNQDFTKALSQTLKVIQLPNAPAFVIKLALGEMSELVLSSTRVTPRKLIDLGFRYKYPKLEDALAELAEVGSH
ncbi:MAG: TIGR01777 family protein [Bdellovibrionaceae bacterium]|nr:TIGR01777 family protein [Bdellovibrio sp.]